MSQRALALNKFKGGGQHVPSLWMRSREGSVQSVPTLSVRAAEGGWQIATPLRSQVARWWMSAQPRFLPPNFLSVRPIETERIDCGPACGADTNDSDSIPAEVEPPRITAGMKERNSFAGSWVGGGLTRAFAQRTRDARERQIARLGRSRRLQRNNVIDVKGGFLPELREAAILAPVSSAMNDLRAKMRGDKHGITPLAWPGVVRANESAKEPRPGQPAPRPRASRRRSIVCPDLACRAASAAAYRRLLEVGILPGRRATQSRTGCALTYSLNRCADATRRCPASPNLKLGSLYPELP